MSWLAPDVQPEASSRFRPIAIIGLCQVAAMALWFSATAVIAALKREVAPDAATASLFTSAVQLGFVVGTLASTFLSLADRLDLRHFLWHRRLSPV